MDFLIAFLFLRTRRKWLQSHLLRFLVDVMQADSSKAPVAGAAPVSGSGAPAEADPAELTKFVSTFRAVVGPENAMF